MNRFATDKEFSVPEWAGRAVRVLIVGIILFLFLFFVNRFGQQTIERQEESLVNAVNRDIVQCYALEGVYPPSLSYIEEHYGLTYDHSTFYVDYRPVGGNLYPDVTVIHVRKKAP